MPQKSRRTRLGLVLAGSLVLAACGGGGFEEDTGDGSTAPASAEGPVELQMLIASSGDAETAAVQEAVDAWSEETGNSVTVTVASDMNQQLAQGFASGNPADVFYMDAGRFADYAQNGSLYAYADQLEDNDDFYESLRQAFTYDGTQYCAPKDFSSLALVINTASWEAAGLTEADVPTTWDELTEVAQTLTTDDQAGLGIGIGIDRLGAFVVQNGGWWLNEEATEPTAAIPEVEEALGYVQEQVQAGSFQMSNQLDAGWGGEAFGTERAAMTIEGNWIKGAMSNDYPNVEYIVAELPEGPAGKGTLTFTQCWGIAADSDAQAQAVELVRALTTVDQQMAFAEAFGVMPSRTSAADPYREQFPEDAAFIAGGEYGHGPINAPGMEQVVADLNSKLENFEQANLPTVLSEFDTNAAAALGQ
ncbi:extracellular solute-binding protein [Nostocoides sp. F2B08]|uniref:sugar ABC transporter substrate-binding protein n=1 Tax=Nostocoides sp. F2B08 TaxID=2653936 RepID=UPI001262B843|nr:extracellular solute-binding protein [Tetrasphaera sp. F2B08]KAB7742406.1 extracellular solute-binding protein [Tetrasphaera sp. F2B08]